MPKEESYFVGIPGPKAIRKDLLLTSKDLITVLRKMELIENLTQEREAELMSFRKTLAELTKLMKSLKGALPKHKLPRKKAVVQKETQTVLDKSVPKAKRPVVPKHNPKLDKLENELSKIESKLEELE